MADKFLGPIKTLYQLITQPYSTLVGMWNAISDLGRSVLSGDVAALAQAIMPNVYNLLVKWTSSSWLQSGEYAGGGIVEAVQLSQAAASVATTLVGGTAAFAKIVKHELRGCFVAGTHLRTPEGSRPIEEIQPGDLVLSSPEFGGHGEIRPKRVVRTVRRLAKIGELRVGGRVIRVTAEHPFWVRGKGWFGAGELQKGDQLYSHDGQWLEVEGWTELDQYAIVYNLEVEEDHTYFIGCEDWRFSVWAHNSTGRQHQHYQQIPHVS